MSGATRSTVDQIVVSVGPYRFHSSPPPASSGAASSGGSASPPHSIRSPGPPVQPASSSSRHVAGVACSTVAPAWVSRACSSFPSAASVRLAISTRAPTVSGSHSSSPAISNDSVVTATTTSVAVSPGVVAMLARKFSTARCGTATPFGWPVDPDV